MAQLSTKIKSYCEANGVSDVDFTKDVMLQDDSDGNGAYIKEWNLDIKKPTEAQLKALENDANKWEKNQEVIAKRKEKYGSVESQIEYAVENGFEALVKRNLDIKAKNKKS
jgi:hypothetical protein